MIGRNIVIVGLSIATVWVASTLSCSAGECPGAIRTPDSLASGFEHLLAVADPEQNAEFDLKHIEAVLEFVSSDQKCPDSLYYTKFLSDSASAYYEFEAGVSLNDILQYVYNPKIPAYVFTPSSVRMSYWQTADIHSPPYPDLSNFYISSEKPVVIRGVEHIVNTPDLFTGGYYEYDLNRVFIAMNYKGRNILISLSKQMGTSDVGKKGLVLGDDGDWNYYYSGEKGLARRGLGWVDSYMYDSFSISIYVEMDTARPLVICGCFKWLDAGWSGHNFVKPEHIQSGLKRYSDDFKRIIESPGLPDPIKMVSWFSSLYRLPMDALKADIEDYLNHLESRYLTETSGGSRQFKKMFSIDKILNQMTREEMQAVIGVEYIKMVIGNNLILHRVLDTNFFSPNSP